MFDWPHAPLHRFTSGGTFFVTGATYLKRHYYRDPSHLDRFVALLFALTREHGLVLQAWTVFSNHYHLVAEAGGEPLRIMLRRLHSLEARACNRDDASPERKVWYQFRDTQLTYERSWLARLHYTHENAVKHGLVPEARKYRWCSAGWFERHATPAFVRSVKSFKIDRVSVPDDFEVEPPV